MISYKKLKEIRPEDIGRDNDRCYNCPTKIVLNEIFGVEIKEQGCLEAFIKNMLPLIPEKIKKKFSFNYCTECRLASIVIYETTTRNKI